MFSLNDSFVKQIIKETLPSFQNVEELNLNLGFGYIYYSLVRALRPKNIVVIGSKAGFAPVIFGLGIKDNEGFGIGKIDCYNTSNVAQSENGKVFFIDPSYSIERNDSNHWYGIGFWDDKEEVDSFWKKFNVDGIVNHYKMTSDEFSKSEYCPLDIDLIYIDGDHSYDGIMNDFNSFFPKIKRNGIILAHDVDPHVPILLPDSGGYEVFNDLPSDKFEKLRLPIFPGLAIIRKR